MGTTKYHQYTHEQRMTYLKEFDESGLSVRAFCENRELSHWTLGKWVKARRNKSGVFGSEEVSENTFVNLTQMKPVQATLAVHNERINPSPITVHRGQWHISIPRNVQSRDLELVMRVLEVVDGI